MCLFSLWLQGVIFSSWHDGPWAVPSSLCRVPPPAEGKTTFPRTENVLKNASSRWQEPAVYHRVGIFFSWPITIACSHKCLLRRCTEIAVPLQLMWKLMPDSPIPDFFPWFCFVFSLLCSEQVVWGHRVIGFSCVFLSFRERLKFELRGENGIDNP